MITIDWDQKLYMLSFIQTFNRYGPWMDTNLVLPLGPRRCQVVFDYFLEASLKVLHGFKELQRHTQKKNERKRK
ncbi:hypothetical protein RGQ29_025954 [Quercus rubra]|uniref:Uncharacterized protein n=1 Tax=Quercus rubra TaxID=3512 RepID=A0AAN7EZN7_QUERU|nr:hypothetical protein RGQ29_025954 [Quercus rubra]KAK4582992.1 hypothetical protein RGQ29_025954 [Quercus rubra]